MDAMVGLTQRRDGAVVADKVIATESLVVLITLFVRHRAFVHKLIVMQEDARDVETIRARHAVLTVVARYGRVLQDEMCCLFEILHILVGQRFERTIGAKIVFEVLHIGHARKHGEDVRISAEEAESPGSGTVVWPALLEMCNHMVRQLRESSTKQWLHDDDRDIALGKLLIEIAAVARNPIDIVHLDLHEVPVILSFVVHLHHMVEHRVVAMIREAEVADLAFLLLSDKEIENAVADISLVEVLHAASDAVEKHIVDIIDLQFGKRFIVQGNGCFAALLLFSEVRQLGSDEILVARMTLEGNACGAFGKSAEIGRTRVKIVHAMLDGGINKTIDSLLIDHACLWVIWPAHTAIAKDRDLVATFLIGPVGHFAYWLGTRT